MVATGGCGGDRTPLSLCYLDPKDFSHVVVNPPFGVKEGDKQILTRQFI